MNRRTVADEIIVEGIGLHRGQSTKLYIRPSDEGIVFVKDGVRIQAEPSNIVDTRLCTTIGCQAFRISTVEHLMSALYGLKITDCEIEITGEEIPVMDGSALPFVARLQEAGYRDMDVVCPEITISETIRVESNKCWVEIGPGPFSVEYAIEFEEPAIGSQHITFGGMDYCTDIAPARTFGRLKDVEAMRSMGLALGGGLHNAVVVDNDRVLNPGGLRFKDEFVRHKVLDLLGDLWMVGAFLRGRIRAYKANHALHIELAKKICATAKE